MSLGWVTSVGGYVDSKHLAVFEVGDSRKRPEHELKDLTKSPVFLDPLDEGLEGI